MMMSHKAGRKMLKNTEKALGWIVIILSAIGLPLCIYVLVVSAIHFHTVKRLCILIMVIAAGMFVLLARRKRAGKENA